MTQFGGRSQSAKGFDPATLSLYSVINVPVRRLDDDTKLMVVLGHSEGHAICVKATSRVAPFLNNPDRLKGVVFYRDGESCFRKDTVVEPDNKFAIPHDDITRECVVGSLPADFNGRFINAVIASDTLRSKERKALLAMIGVTA